MRLTPEVRKILDEGNVKQLLALFQFTPEDGVERIEKKFILWSRYFFPKFFSSKDAPEHGEVDRGNIRVYIGEKSEFLDIAFRGFSKTTRTKLFIAFCIANDISHFRKYFKVLSKDVGNAKQTTTDVYNMLISRRVRALYPQIFQKTDAKREETMASFTTATGIKMTADTIGTDQRGQIQDESRPDFIFFDDIETRISLMSAITTHKIWQNMDEALTGLAKGGGAVYCCNYVSELGNVHKLVQKIDHKVIIPIERNGKPVWERYSKEDIAQIKKSVEDFEGDYLCKPSASRDIYFDRASIEAMPILQPIREIAGFKIFKKYDPSHRYASGHDVAGGVGLDSSTSVVIDFDTIPAQVVGTFADNMILPESFGDEIYHQTNIFGACIAGVENNKFDQTILKAKQLGANLFKMKRGQTLNTLTISQGNWVYGWNTNSLTKSKALSDLRKAVADGLIALNDESLMNELKSYTRNDLIDAEPDTRLTTRHFDLLMACAIAWQMKDHAVVFEPEQIDYLGRIEENVNPAL